MSEFPALLKEEGTQLENGLSELGTTHCYKMACANKVHCQKISREKKKKKILENRQRERGAVLYSVH